MCGPPIKVVQPPQRRSVGVTGVRLTAASKVAGFFQTVLQSLLEDRRDEAAVSPVVVVFGEHLVARLRRVGGRCRGAERILVLRDKRQSPVYPVFVGRVLGEIPRPVFPPGARPAKLDGGVLFAQGVEVAGPDRRVLGVIRKIFVGPLPMAKQSRASA